MDTKKLLADAKARFNHNSAKKYLSEKYQSKLVLADQGGLWKITPALLSQLNSSTAKTLILIDDYGNPVQVDRKLLLLKANEIYVSVMDAWLYEFNDLSSKR
jgi:predicted transcriptional regulator